MGVFYHTQSIALLEDVAGLEEPGMTPEKLYNLADLGYSAVSICSMMLLIITILYEMFCLFQNAMNCWIAACLYILTLLLSGHQFYVNSRNALTM